MEVKPGYKQTEVGVIPEDWDVFKLSEHFRIYAGGDVPKHSVSSFRSETHPYPIFANAVQDRGLYGFTNELRAKADSVTVTARGYLGHAEYRDEPFFPIVRLLVLEPSGALDARFTTFAVNERVKFAFESTGVPQLTAPQIGKYSVAAPKPLEQRAIAQALSDVDALLGALDRLIAKKRDLKQAAMQQLLTGQTRLPGFHGEWESKELGKLIKEIGDGATPSTADSRNFGGGINWVVIDDIKDEIITTATTLTERGLRSCSATLWQPGTLIISTGATIGEVGIARVPVATKQGICGIVFDESQAIAGFMKYWFAQNKPTILGKAQGSTIKEVRAPTLVKIELSVPAITEQTAIAEVLTDMDEELAALEQRRAKTRNLKQAMMQELLTGKTRLVKTNKPHA